MPGRSERKRKDVERQVAALPLRLSADRSPEVLLVTSRETRRWVVPKGHLMKGLAKHEAAAVEAEEEAGVVGRVISEPYGRFDYWKRRRASFQFCRVDLFLLLVLAEEEEWKESHQRTRTWMTPSQAYERVLEPGLQTILAKLDRDARIGELMRCLQMGDDSSLIAERESGRSLLLQSS